MDVNFCSRSLALRDFFRDVIGSLVTNVSLLFLLNNIFQLWAGFSGGAVMREKDGFT